MSRPRKRAVRLTFEALEALQKALGKRWKAAGRSGRMTREARAEMMGVSVVTAGRILKRGGVDRATLELAFGELGLAWNDHYCEPMPEAEEVPASSEAEKPAAEEILVAAPVPAAAPISEPISKPLSPAPKPLSIPHVRKRVPARRLVLAGALAVSTIAASYLTLGPAFGSPFAPRWTKQYEVLYHQGIDRFDRADYRGARATLDQALSITKQHDVGGSLAESYRYTGDLAAAEGRLTEARDKFRMAFHIRKDMGQDHCLPSLYEAIGDVETRMRNFDSARENLLLSLEGYRRYDEHPGIAMAKRDLGSVAAATGRLDEADDLFRQALAEVPEAEQLPMRQDIHERQALVLIQRGRPAVAKGMLRTCLAYWTARDHGRWVADCERDLALAEAALGDGETAAVRMRRSRDGFARVGDQAGVRDTENYLRQLVARR